MTNRTLAYLATPYIRYPHGIERAFTEAARIASRLLSAGVNIYSPITHSHCLTVHGGLAPGDHSFWLPFDELMMSRCDSLIVAHMDGWQESVGIAHEVAFFQMMGKPIFDCDPLSMALVRRPMHPDDRVPVQIAG